MPPSWASYRLTQGFGPTDEPLDSGGINKGHDYAVPVGTAIDVAVPGVVIAAGDQGDGWGLSVKVRDADGYIHNYGHLSSVAVKPGQQLGEGAVVGASGNTGKSTGPHLSYDVKAPDGGYVDPTDWIKGSMKARTAPEAEAITMNDTSMESLWGYLIPYLAEQVNGPAANRDITLQTLAGYLNPNALGFDTGSGVPTLARDMFEEAQHEADRQYALDVGRFGLAQAQLNYQQRLSEAQTRIQELALLSSQRGPSNQLAYQYNLRGLSAPAGTAVNPHQGSQNINQPSAITMPTVAPRPETTEKVWGDPKTPPPPPPIETPSMTPTFDAALASGGTPIVDKTSGATTGTQWTNPGGSSIGYSNEFIQMVQSNPDLAKQVERWFEPPKKMAAGGVSDGIAVVGEEEPELVIALPEGFAVLNEEQLGMDPMAVSASGGSGGGSEQQLLEEIGALLRSAMGGAGAPTKSRGVRRPSKGVTPARPQEGDRRPPIQNLPSYGGASGPSMAPIPNGRPGDGAALMPLRARRAAEGAIIDNTLYDPAAMAGQPAIQSIAQGIRLPAFQGTSLNMQLPGTDTTLPMGHKTNVQDLMAMHQSERDTLQGFIETPREMGGLGLMFGDWLEDATRAAPTGRSFGPAGYGG